VHRARAALVASGTQLPFCAFNGGRDAWVDVGNKRIGVEAMQIFLGLPPHKCLHVGDQFLKVEPCSPSHFIAVRTCNCIRLNNKKS